MDRSTGPSNRYSPRWFDVFLRSVPLEQTAAEVAFLARQLPQPDCRTVLDVCCGWGRHSRALAALGYQVTGVDRDEAALAEARRLAGPSVAYQAADLRDLTAFGGRFDAVVNLWQSFGYFDDATNERVLRQLAACLRPGGRLVLDLYHRDFYARHQGERRYERQGVTITSHTRLVDRRLIVEVAYDASGTGDRFEWRLYTPPELIDLAAGADLACLLTCANFDEHQTATDDAYRMQLVFVAGTA